MRLIPMVDFVLNGQLTADYIKLYNGCFKYANFLKQPLEIWMFVPCKLVDSVWVVLEEPHRYDDFLKLSKREGFTIWYERCKEYQQAKERCLFEGFKVKEHSHKSVTNNNISLYFGETRKDSIESLSKYNLQLAQTAIKQLTL